MPQIATTASTNFHYRKTGRGPALVLLHGFPASSALWDGVAGELSKSFTLLLPDFPGSGNSVLSKQLSMASLADSIAAIMKQERINTAVIAGHSMGGYVALEFANKYPGKLAGLSLIHSTPLPDDAEKINIRQRTIELLQKDNGREQFVRQTTPNLFSDQSKKSKPQLVEEQVARAMKVSAEAMINCYHAMIARHDRTNVLDDYTSFPVQWILGIDDNLINYNKILKFCYRSPVNFVSAYENCGHMSMIEEPGKLINDVKKFTNYCYGNN
jgi:pimeloyl-ACP methyl ester carboxylesterase